MENTLGEKLNRMDASFYTLPSTQDANKMLWVGRIMLNKIMRHYKNADKLIEKHGLKED